MSSRMDDVANQLYGGLSESQEKEYNKEEAQKLYDYIDLRWREGIYPFRLCYGKGQDQGIELPEDVIKAILDYLEGIIYD